MGPWPASVPDYRWPADRRNPAGTLWRCGLAVVFYVAHFAGRLAQFFCPRTGRVLLIRTDGLGDAVLFEPAVRSLAARFAGRRVVVWAAGPACEFFRHHPSVHESAEVPRGGKAGNLEYRDSLRWHGRLGWRLGRNVFEVAIYPVESAEPMGDWLLVSARARDRWYALGDTENQFDWQRSQTAAAATRLLQPRLLGGHELVRNAHLAAQWRGEADLRPRVHLPHDVRERAGRMIDEARRAGKSLGAGGVIGVMLGSASPLNRYPAERWASIVRSLFTEHRRMCVLFGTEADQPRIEALAALLDDVPIARFPPGAGLSLTAAAVAHVDGFLTLDTGLAHVAVAQDAPTVVLRHGRHPGRFFPWPDENSAIVQCGEACNHCDCRQTGIDPHCLAGIEVNDVLKACEHKFNLRRRTAAVAA